MTTLVSHHVRHRLSLLKGRPLVPLVWEQIVFAARDAAALGQWWADALGWVVVDADPEAFEIRAAPETMPGLMFLPVPEEKAGKNRLHLDFRPADQAAEVERLIGLGARRVDIGQGEVRWVVLTDPEGNEFCVLSPPPPGVTFPGLA